MQKTIVLNPDELDQDPAVGMDLAVELGVTHLEIRTAYGANALVLDDGQLRQVRRLADDRELTIAALASPLWKWCPADANPGKVDSFGFPTRVAPGERADWVDRALTVASVLGTSRVRVFSHLRVEDTLTETLHDDPLLPYALARAEQEGVRLLLENEPVCTVARLEPLLDVLGRFPGLGLWLDLGNLHEVGDGTVDAVRTLAPRTEYVHVKDFLPRPDEGHGDKAFVAPGSGAVPYRELLPVLAQERPGLLYGLETHVRDEPAVALAKGAAFLHDVLPGDPE
ncbi:sugar phosphate isomerase/epimerase family protein [Streptomyces sp. NPDC087440]|uniref:sugar phosphate isomerase/epimerase family protein n=1 Tax=Streptomyces sp. NPDC087440 TaxID=3365790 RepID=UPI0038246470